MRGASTAIWTPIVTGSFGCYPSHRDQSLSDGKYHWHGHLVAGEFVEGRAMTSLIRQRLRTDCAICTIAMALGKPYEAVMEAALAAKAFSSDRGTNAEYSVIEKFGLKQMIDFRIMHRGQLAPEYFRHFSWGRRAILAVPSLNNEGGFHSVFWSGCQLFDPCTRKTYSKWDELRPDEIILIAETGAHPR